MYYSLPDVKVGGIQTSASAFTRVKLYSLILFALLALLLLLLLVARRFRAVTFYNDLYANLVTCALLCACVARPMTLLQSVPSYIPHPAYCTAYIFVLEMETVTIPLAVLMLTIERVVYFRCLWCFTPGSLAWYQGRLSAPRRILMVVLPWLVGTLLAVIKTFVLLNPIEVAASTSLSVPAKAGQFGVMPPAGATPLVTMTTADTVTMATSYGVTMATTDAVTMTTRGNGTPGALPSEDGAPAYTCHMTGRSRAAHLFGEAILYTFRSSFPLVYLGVCWGLMMVSWWSAYYTVYPELRQDADVQEAEVQHGQPANGTSLHAWVQEDMNVITAPLGCMCARGACREVLPEKRAKTHATVWIGGMLVLWCTCVALIGSWLCKRSGWLTEDTQWLYFSLEVALVVCACFKFPEVSQTLLCKEACWERKGRGREVVKRGGNSCFRSEEGRLATRLATNNNNMSMTRGGTPGDDHQQQQQKHD